MTDLVQVVLHLVHMASLDQHALTAAHGLQECLISLLLLDNLFLRAKVLSFLPQLALHDVIRAQVAQLLLKHQLMVLVPHKILNLLLTSFELDHDLPVSLLDGLTVVTLSGAAVLERITPQLLRFIVLAQLLLVEGLQGTVLRLFHLFCSLKIALNIIHLVVPMRLELLAER